MNTGNQKIKMTYVCHQDWDDMESTKNGKFCGICNHEVIDFTKYSNREFGKITDKALCGRFTIEQVDNDVIAPIELPKAAKTVGLFASILLGLITQKSFGQSNPSYKADTIELSDNYKNSTREQTCMDTVPDTSKKELKKNTRKTFKIFKRRYYLTKRFPFIRKQIPRIIGRMRLDW